MSQSNFSTLNLSPALLKNLVTLDYHAMTPIQAEALPAILAGKDVIAQAQTGSGKTAAFALGLLQKLKVKRFRIQSLVLCPTRELADQVAKEIRKLGRAVHNIKVLTLCGGAPLGPQIGSLEHGAHIVVGTPGRIEDHLGKGTLSLGEVNLLILDEADRMLEMGFQSQLDTIIASLTQQRQTLMFSATFPESIKKIAQQIMHQPVNVNVASTHDNSTIKQHLFMADNDGHRLQVLRLLLQHYQPQSAVVFCNTKIETQMLADELSDYGYSTMALHGDLEQRDRDQTLVRFVNKSISILVATDVAARGLDIESLDAVINYQIAREIEVHVHRVGRTGRAGKQGIALTIITEKEKFKLARLEAYLQQKINVERLPAMNLLDKAVYQPAMLTLQIDGGKKQKLRPGDILGGLTGVNGISGKQVGKIQIFANKAYVAVAREVAQYAMRKIADGKLKGRNFRVRII